MSPQALLLLLRILSALTLLAFLGALGWFLYRDLQLATQSLEQHKFDFGFLQVMMPAKEPTRYRLRPVMSIGRVTSNTVILDNGYASSQHALVTHRDNQWWVEDLQSRNGTLVNSVPIDEPTVVTVGDTITIGDAILTLEL